MDDDKTLEQRWWLERRRFRITDDGVHVAYSKLMNTQQFRVPFESIPTDTIETTKRHPIWFLLTMTFVVFMFLGIILNLEKGQSAKAAQMGAIWAALALASAGAFIFTRQKLIAFATGDGSLVFYASSPSPQRVSGFMAAVIRARDAHLKARYQPPVAGESPIDAIERLNALRERKVISEEEFNSLKSRIVGVPAAPGREPSGGTYL